MEYKIVRSARKTITVCVSHDNEITVRCPLKISRERIEKFLNDKKSWIEKVVKANAANMSVNADVLDYKKIYVEGALLLVIFSDKNAITDNAVYLRSVSDIKKTLIAFKSKKFLDYVEELTEKTGLKARSFELKSYKSRWGCCDGNGNIKFNYKLLMLSRELQTYVIIHELCHTEIFNHSKYFWGLVRKFLPDYKKLKHKLKSFDFLTKL